MLRFGEYEGKVKTVTADQVIVGVKRQNVVCSADGLTDVPVKGQEIKVKISGIDQRSGSYKGHVVK